MTSKNLVLLSPVIGAFLIFLGVLKLQVFYSHFNIEIVDYLDFSEILTSFLDDINIFLICLIFMILHVFFGGVVLIPGALKAYSFLKKSTAGGLDTDKFIEQFSAGGWVIMAVSVVAAALAFWGVFEFQKVWLLYFAILITWQAVVVSLEIVWPSLKTLDHRALLPLTVAFMLILFSWTKSQLEIRMIKTLPDKYIIMTDGETIATSCHRIVLGKTSGYLFIHDLTDRSNYILPVVRIKSIQVFEHR